MTKKMAEATEKLQGESRAVTGEDQDQNFQNRARRGVIKGVNKKSKQRHHSYSS